MRERKYLSRKLPIPLHKNRLSISNRGFTLLELLISIAILVLVMVPLMNYFFHSMRMNQQAQEIQEQTNLAANIMEGIKAYGMPDIIRQFADPEQEEFTIIPGLTRNEDMDHDGILNYPVYLLKKPDEAVRRFELSDDTALQQMNYFGIHGVSMENKTYDALIKMDAREYNVLNSNTMNDYVMPDIITLDENANGMFFSNGTSMTDPYDEDALDALTESGRWYAQTVLWLRDPMYLQYQRDLQEYDQACLEQQAIGGPTPAPIPVVSFDPDSVDYTSYCNKETIKTNVTKTIKITMNTVSKMVGSATVTVSKIKTEFIYQVTNWLPEMEDIAVVTKTLPALEKEYPKQIENVYLFYLPSIFQESVSSGLRDPMYSPDEIQIDNNTGSPVNLFIARQNTSSLARPYIKVKRNNISDQARVFTNLEDGYVTTVDNSGNPISATISNGLMDGSRENRIYAVTIEICTPQERLEDRYQDVLYTLQSTKEELD